MRFVSVRDLRGKSAEVWKRLSTEKDMVITSNGRPIAILSGVSEDSLEESFKALRRIRAVQAVEAMQMTASRTGLDHLTAKDVDAEINSVRKRRRR